MEAIYELYVEGGVTAIMVVCFVGQMVWMQKTLVQKLDEIHQEDIEDSKQIYSIVVKLIDKINVLNDDAKNRTISQMESFQGVKTDLNYILGKVNGGSRQNR
tara:strand:- start:282 stop:587 length:306 start_codon:yes stop_codon:yes gene_type:complete